MLTKKRGKAQRDSLSAVTGTIIPDYQVPDAIMVPHYQSDITPLLEEIATRVSKYCGVILLSNDQAFTQAFIRTKNNPAHFSVVTARFDSPWIRDRSPIAIKTARGIRWSIPRSDTTDRPNDNRLFARICSTPRDRSPVSFLPQGNIVTGARGLALVSQDVLQDNDLCLTDLDSYSQPLGIKHWLIFRNFTREQTGHADVHVRVLRPRLIAVAWNLSLKRDRETTTKLIKKIQHFDRGIRVVKIPIRSKGKQYASLVNWLQIGKRLLVPRYPITEAADIEETQNLLQKNGFKVEFIYSPTLEYSGSLHCLTASIFV